METVHGFYRYTDIIFQWHKAVYHEEMEVAPLRALLSHDALVDRGHPLYKPGANGIELYKGFFPPNGEARLLFSSAQVEYMRYWLHEMGLTKRKLPVPCAGDLIQRSDMVVVSPVVYNDAKKLKVAVSTTEKENKRLKGAGPGPQMRRVSFEKMRSFWAGKMGTWLAMDFEAWEEDHSVLTEFGYSLVRWENEAEVSETGHWIVQENRKYVNRKYVKGQRDNYSFGQSEDIEHADWRRRICGLIQNHREQGPLFLLFHDSRMDIECLRKDVGAQLDDIYWDLPDMIPHSGTYVIDTADMYGTLKGIPAHQKTGLKAICKQFAIPVQYLHNAGNDAHYTLLAAKMMATGDPCEIQREKMWPTEQKQNTKRSREE